MPYGVISYRLYQWKANNTQEITNTTSVLLYDGNKISYDSTSLDKDQTYYYQVIPYNIKYSLNGPSSQLINGTTHEDSKYMLTCGEQVFITVIFEVFLVICAYKFILWNCKILSRSLIISKLQNSS